MCLRGSGRAEMHNSEGKVICKRIHGPGVDCGRKRTLHLGGVDREGMHGKGRAVLEGGGICRCSVTRDVGGRKIHGLDIMPGRGSRGLSRITERQQVALPITLHHACPHALSIPPGQMGCRRIGGGRAGSKASRWGKGGQRRQCAPGCPPPRHRAPSCSRVYAPQMGDVAVPHVVVLHVHGAGPRGMWYGAPSLRHSLGMGLLSTRTRLADTTADCT